MTGETGGDVAGMTGVTRDVFAAVTAVTSVTGGLDVPAVRVAAATVTHGPPPP